MDTLTSVWDSATSAASSAWGSFLTGASGLVSAATGGATPIYGEPPGTTAADRAAVLSGAAVATAKQVVEDPLRPVERGLDVVGEGVDAVSDRIVPKLAGMVPWYVWAGAAAWLSHELGLWGRRG